jgi:anti-sigma regulatory factor (Ser/Thr protein kinase)
VKHSAVIAIPSDPKYLSVVRAVTSRMAQICGIGPAEVESLTLAVDEACSNVIKYSYHGDHDKRILVRFRIARRFFEVVIEDDGLKADPACIQGRDLDEIRPGGLGVHFIRRGFDTITFDERKKKGNRLRLRKRFGSP